MPRPICPRVVSGSPAATYFKPAGIPLRELRENQLTLDQFEALRLADLEGLGQEEAAGRMGISRQTFGRIIKQARVAVARSVVRGEALRIDRGA
ncbi:DUF134 domain-containing protein [Haloferula sargassicola]|uniref:UPF0251 protein Hsar01_00304 n=1 Tax=Haloferula sargassicola TaxID=490096 RepID=A0ABP9UMV4_9BACT